MPQIKALTEQQIRAKFNINDDTLRQIQRSHDAARRAADRARLWRRVRKSWDTVEQAAGQGPTWILHRTLDIVIAICQGIAILSAGVSRFVKSFGVWILLFSCLFTAVLLWTLWPEVEAYACRNYIWYDRVHWFKAIASRTTSRCAEHARFENERVANQTAIREKMAEAATNYDNLINSQENVTGIYGLVEHSHDLSKSLLWEFDASQDQVYDGSLLVAHLANVTSSLGMQEKALSRFVPKLTAFQSSTSADAIDLQHRIQSYEVWAGEHSWQATFLNVLANSFSLAQKSLQKPKLERVAWQFIKRLIASTDEHLVAVDALLESNEDTQYQLVKLQDYMKRSNKDYLTACHDYNSYQQLRGMNPFDWVSLASYSALGLPQNVRNVCLMTNPDEHQKHINDLLEHVKHIKVIGKKYKHRLVAIRQTLSDILEKGQQELQNKAVVVYQSLSGPYPLHLDLDDDDGEKEKLHQQEHHIGKLELENNIKPAEFFLSSLDELLKVVGGQEVLEEMLKKKKKEVGEGTKNVGW